MVYICCTVYNILNFFTVLIAENAMIFEVFDNDEYSFFEFLRVINARTRDI